MQPHTITWQTSSNLEHKLHKGGISSISAGVSEAINLPWAKPFLRFQHVAQSGRARGEWQGESGFTYRKLSMLGSKATCDWIQKAVMRWWLIPIANTMSFFLFHFSKTEAISTLTLGNLNTEMTKYTKYCILWGVWLDGMTYTAKISPSLSRISFKYVFF